MKNFTPCLLILTSALTFSHTATAEQSYQLTCRGGGTMTASAFGATGGSSAQISFTRGTRAAPEGINPGSCTWSDRGMRSNEPNLICHTVLNRWPSVTWDVKSRSIRNVQLNQAGYLDSLSYDNFYQIFQVFNDGF